MTGTIQSYIDFSKLRYFWVYNSQIFYVYTDNQIIVEDFDFVQLKKHLTYHWKQYATIASGISDKIFYINLQELQSVTSDSADLILTFSNDSITIAMLNSTDATYNKNYLNFAWRNYDITRINKTAITVNTGLTETAGVNYDTVQEAINYIFSNNLTDTKYVSVDVYEGTESITLKNGVDIYFADGTLINNTTNGSNIFKDNGATVECNIYGEGVFTKNNTLGSLGANAVLKISGDDTHINFGFKKIISIENPVIYAEDSAPLRPMYMLKGKTATTYTLIQNNAGVLHADCDVMKIQCSVNIISFQTETNSGYCYVRNSDCYNTGADYSIATDNTSGVANNIFLMLVNINSSDLSCLSSEANTGHTFHSFASRYYVANYDYFIEQFSPGGINNTQYIGYGNQNYTNKPAEASVLQSGDEINETSEYSLIVGDISSTADGDTATIKIDPVVSADEYEIYDDIDYIDTITIDPASELGYTYTMTDRSTPYLFRYRGKRGTDYSGYSRRSKQSYFGRSVIL